MTETIWQLSNSGLCALLRGKMVTDIGIEYTTLEAQISNYYTSTEVSSILTLRHVGSEGTQIKL